MLGKTFTVGEEATLVHVVSEEDVRAFARITGDDNPIHLDREYAKDTRFGKPIAHGLLVAGFISAVLGTKLPGPGAIYLSQSLTFLAPVHPGDTIAAMARVTEVDTMKGIITVHTEVRNQSNAKVISGEARLLVEGATH